MHDGDRASAGAKREFASRSGRPVGATGTKPVDALVADLKFVEIDHSRASLALLARFYRDNYVAEFPDPDERESLANMRRYLALKAQGWYGPNSYHIVIALLDGAAVGGVVFDYLAAAHAGVIEFLFVDAAYRVAGLGRALLDECIRILRTDARTHRGRPLKAVIAEMNDPYRRPAMPDNMNPFRRAAIWGKWGFQALGFPYVQPALSAGQAPVNCLLLIARVFGRQPKTGVSSAWVELVVGEYLRWAMRIENPAHDADYRGMAAFLGSRRRISLCPLQHYIGHDPTREFEIAEVLGKANAFPGNAPNPSGEADFVAAIELAREAIPVPGRVASPEQFSAAMKANHAGGAAYHLWALRAPAAETIEGMASFFTLATSGFGGYIVLVGSLRGRGLLPLVVRRIEHQMMLDATKAEGWFIECGSESVNVFRRAGFAEVPLEYRPPAVGESRASSPPERLFLLYKPFGVAHWPLRLSRSFVLGTLQEILHDVYGVAAPRRHQCYRLARHTLTCDTHNYTLLHDASVGLNNQRQWRRILVQLSQRICSGTTRRIA